MAAKDKNIRRGIELYIDGKEVKNDIRAVEAEAKKLKKEIRGMTIGSEEYIQTSKRIRQLDKVLQQHRKEIKAVEVQQESLISRGVKWFKDYSLQITGAIAALTGVAMKLNEFRRQAAEKEDAAANLKALTGLDDENIEWLTQQADKLSTTMEKSGLRVRKSTKEILEAYMLVGSAKPELLKDKQALNAVTVEAMRLAEAAKMDLKDAVSSLTTSLNQYSAGADQAARYTNVLAAGSKFGAANVQDQAAAILKAGVSASSANISIEETVGLIEMLGEKGVKAEVAGTGLKTFLLKLQTGADDTNPAVVGLNKALENLAAKGLSMGELEKMFGERAINVAKILVDNTEKVQEYTKAVTDTNIATEQAAINSNTTAAKMAQMRNQLSLTGQELAKTLAPIFSTTLGWTRKFVLAMPPLINFIKKYGKEILLVSSYLVVLTTYQKAVTLWHTFWAAAAAGVQAYRAAIVLTSDAVAGCTLATARLSTLMAAQNIIVKAATAAAILMKTAYYGLTLQFTAASRSLAAFNAVAKLNPYAIVITAIAALIYGYSKLVEKVDVAARKMKEMKKIQDQASDTTRAERDEIKRLSEIIHDSNSTYSARKKAIEDMQKIVPDYHASLTKEGKLINDNVEAIERYVETLTLQAQAEAVSAKITEANVKKRKYEQENEKRLFDALAAKAEYEQQLLYGSKKYNSPEEAAAVLFGMSPTVYRSILSQYNTLKGEVDMYQSMLDDLQAKMKKVYEASANASSGNDDDPEYTGGGDGETETETEREKRIRKELEAIDAEYNKRAAELKQQYINGDIKTDQEYSMRRQQIEMERLKAKMKVMGLDEKQTSEFMNRIKDIEVGIRQRINEMTKTTAKDSVDARLEALQQEFEASKEYLTKAYEIGIIPTEEKYKEYLLALENNYNLKEKELLEKKADEEIAQLKDEESKALMELKLARAERLITEEEYEKKLLSLKKEYARKRKEVENQSKEASKQNSKELGEALVNEQKSINSKIEDRNKKTFDILASAAESIGQSIGDVLSDSEKNFGDFAKSLLKIILDTIEKMLVAYIAATTMRNIATLGIFGMAKAAAEIALITAAFEAAKAGIGMMYTGGFTLDGDWDEPQGIVHSNEFVANRHAVANPQVLPVLKLIDAAQKSGSISNLTGQQIATVATGGVSFSKNQSESQQTAGIIMRDQELIAAIRLLVETTQQASQAYKKPVKAYTFIDGKGGVNEAQAMLERIINNASRNI